MYVQSLYCSWFSDFFIHFLRQWQVVIYKCIAHFCRRFSHTTCAYLVECVF